MFLEFLSPHYTFLAFTATSGSSQWFMHVTAQDDCWIYSRINVSCILCIHCMFVEFLFRNFFFFTCTATLCSSLYSTTSCSSLFSSVYDSLWSSKMFHHFFRTFFTCDSTRCLLNLLENKHFLHSMHTYDVCWVSFSKKCFFFTCTATLCFITLSQTISLCPSCIYIFRGCCQIAKLSLNFN